MAEWRERRYSGKNGRMVKWREWLHTYYLRYTHTNNDDDDDDDNDDDDDDDDDDNDDEADRAYGTEISPRSFVISFVILLYAISYNICI
jgi:hypothetical protein